MTAVLSRLLSSFPERDSDDGSKLDRIRSYLVALEDFPASVLEEAERRILKAKAPDIDPRFMPTPPQLARLCGAIRAERIHVKPARPLGVFDKFDAPPDPAVVLKFERITKALWKDADRIRHETRKQWLERMGDRVKFYDDAAS